MRMSYKQQQFRKYTNQYESPMSEHSNFPRVSSVSLGPRSSSTGPKNHSAHPVLRASLSFFSKFSARRVKGITGSAPRFYTEVQHAAARSRSRSRPLYGILIRATFRLDTRGPRNNTGRHVMPFLVDRTRVDSVYIVIHLETNIDR